MEASSSGAEDASTRPKRGAIQRGKRPMKTEELKSLQAPLKERYRERPEAALITLKAEGRLGEGVTCSVETGKALVAAGLHPATGGTGQNACSGDMLLEALVACAGVTLNAVATAIGVDIRKGVVRAEGRPRFPRHARRRQGCARRVSAHPAHLRPRYKCTDDELITLIRLTERYCVVYQSLRQPPDMTGLPSRRRGLKAPPLDHTSAFFRRSPCRCTWTSTKIKGATAEAVAKAHEADVETQKKYGVEYHKYWLNESTGKIFCLCSAPTPEAAAQVHREAHGLLASKIIEVAPEVAEGFMGAPK
jgi:uncharacterized OsmC-like protein